MDVVSSCKDKLAYFRIKELKDVLTKLGLSKQGKKQDLIDRILAVLSDDRVSSMWAKKNAVAKEEVAKLVDDTYRKMQVSGATDLASKGQGISDNSNVKLKEEREDSYELDKIRCVCASTLQTDSMIKCEDPKCHVWQHIGCVIIPQKPTDGVLPSAPEIFYCELCRLTRADPFWVAVAHPLYPVKLTTTNVPTDGTNPVQSVEKTFQLTRADKDLLLKPEYDVQAWCMLLNDKVTFRMQWPQYADLQVNGVPVRAINRPGSQLLGANSRDDGPIITPCTRDGINKIALTGCDARVFCLGVRIVKRRTVQQILNLIPKVSEGEQFEEALARVRRCVGGGAEAENADSDSDIEIVADSIPVNLRCPMSGSRMKIAGRFKPCLHMGCFDLEVFVEMNQRSRKWQCPICLKNYSLENIIIDPYFNRITSKLRDFGEDVTEIEVKPDGSWRAKAEADRRELGELGLWHFPDGTLSLPTNGEVKPKAEGLQSSKQGVSEGHTSLKLGIKKNQNGLWEFSKPGDVHPLSACKLEKFDNNAQNVIPMSSSASGSGRDGEDASVNQDGCLNFDFSANNGVELDSLSLNVDHTRQLASQNTAPFREAEVIVLSDSDEENDATVYKDNTPSDGGLAFPMSAHGMADPYTVDPELSNAGTSCLGLFNTAEDDFGMPLWLPQGSQPSTSFQLFGSEADVSDALVDLHHGPLNCPTSINGYTLTTESPLVPESSADRRNADLNDGLVDNPMAFGGEDPSLQIFLPTRPSGSVMQPELRNQPDVSNSLRSDDWISLRLGGGGTSVHNEPATTTALNTQQQSPSREGTMDSQANTASSLLGRRSREMSEGPFSFPRQRRSVRPRPFLSIDSDSN